jgi:hypothetical protein
VLTTCSKLFGDTVRGLLPPCLPTLTPPVAYSSHACHMLSGLRVTALHSNYVSYCNTQPAKCNVTQFIVSGNCSTCFGRYLHPSSRAQTTVSTAYGICHTVTATCHYRGRVYMFRVVPPPNIRSANNCIYSIWYLSQHRYCYLTLSRKSWNRFECAVGSVRHPQHTQAGSNSPTIAADSSNGVTNTRCCRYSCMRS